MNISCVICSECFHPASETYVTPCGHMFHFECLTTWLNRSKTCPQCRCRVTEKAIFKIYFNLANTDGIKEDVGTLQSRLENLQFEMKMKEKDLKDRKEKCKNMKAINCALRQEIQDLETKARVNESAMHALKEQITYFKNKSKESDRYKEEVFKLKHHMKDFENVQLAIKGTREEVNNMLMNEKNIESLALLAATLKKSLLDCEKRKRDSEHKLKQMQNDATLYRRSTMKYESENAELKKEIEMLKASFAKEKQYLKTKLVETSSQPEVAKSSIKRIMMESPVNYNRKPKLDQSDVICLDDTSSPAIADKVKKIVESDSPYLTVKSGTLDYDSILNKVNYKSGSGSTMNKKSIFRTASSKSDDLQIPKSQSVGYDGLGGQSKDDVFPSPRSAPGPGLKRLKSSSAAVPSKKFKRLAPLPKNAKISEFLDLSDGLSQD